VDSYELCADVRHFVFETPELETLAFTPGQFVSFTEELNGKKITRAYSIASPPRANRFELCLNLVKDGLFSPHLFEMKPGDAVNMRGPLGHFIWRHPLRDSVLVATGTGIAPFRSMLLDALPRGEVHQFTLIFGARYPHGLLYREEFEELARRYANFRFLPTVTRPNEEWRGLTGRVQPHLLEVIEERRDLDVYICGLKEMVDDVRSILKGLQFDRKQIIFEKYD
jgi:CDP-4-dehydro-6-deoxyglucose reductase